MEHIPYSERPDMIGFFAELRDRAREEGRIATRIWLLHPLNPLSTAMILLHDAPTVMEMVSRKSYGKWMKGKVYEISAPLVGRNAILTERDGDIWRHQRKIVASGLSRVVLLNAHNVIYRTFDRLSATWDRMLTTHRSLDVSKEMHRLTMELIGLIAFSYDFKSCLTENVEDALMAKDFDLILKTLTARARGTHVFAWIPTAENRQFDRAISALDTVVNDIIASRKLAKKKPPPAKIDSGLDTPTQPADRKVDILDLLLAEDEAGGGLTQTQIADNIKTLLFAGHDTTASVLAWAIFLVSTHPKVEQRLLQEFADSDSLGLKPGSQEEYEQLEKLPYLGAVVKETLRLHPPAGFSRRPVSRSGERLGPMDVPFGDEVYVLPILIHRDKKYWTDPDDFIPERWLDSEALLDADGKTPEQRGIFIPFSAGMRNCVGRMLAFVELRTTLKLILQRYSFTPEKHEDGKLESPQPVAYLTLCPNRMLMNVTRRP